MCPIKSTEYFTVINNPANCLPNGPGAKICSPPPNSTDSSPVMVSAGARPSSGRITAIRLYIDNSSVFTSSNNTPNDYYSISTSLALSAGTHHLVEVAYQSVGGPQTTGEYFTVTGTSGPLYAYFGSQYPDNLIAGFKIANDGTATAVPGSPYALPSQGFAADPVHNFLFGSNGNVVDTYTIHSDGSLTVSDMLNDAVEGLAIDPMGKTLYGTHNYGSGTVHIDYLDIGSNGSLTMNGYFDEGVAIFLQYFTSNDHFVYQPFCYHFSSEIYGYVRNADGTLTQFQTNAVIPNDGPDSQACPTTIAISPDNRYLVTPLNGVFDQNYHTIAVYKINSDGTLTAVPGSPFAMPATAADAAFDPTGHYVAVATVSGIQIYSFNSATGALTAVGGLQGGANFDQVEWSPSGQLLFATSPMAQAAYIFKVNNGTLTNAPGSPHILNFPAGQIALNQQ